MSAIENTALEHALAVSRNSALTRRRQRANYAVSAARQRTRFDRLLFALLVLVALLVAGIGMVFSPRRLRPENRGLPLSQTTRAHGFDRFNIVHTVTDRDTVWRLAIRYYGSPATTHQQRILDANPWLTNPRDIKIDSKVKIPIS